MQTRSGIALGTLVLLIGLMYFGRLLPDGSAGLESAHPHDSVECQNCHSFGSKAAESGMSQPSSQSCLSCHVEFVAQDRKRAVVDSSLKITR